MHMYLKVLAIVTKHYNGVDSISHFDPGECICQVVLISTKCFVSHPAPSLGSVTRLKKEKYWQINKSIVILVTACRFVTSRHHSEIYIYVCSRCGSKTSL